MDAQIPPTPKSAEQTRQELEQRFGELAKAIATGDCQRHFELRRYVRSDAVVIFVLPFE